MFSFQWFVVLFHLKKINLLLIPYSILAHVSSSDRLGMIGIPVEPCLFRRSVGKKRMVLFLYNKLKVINVPTVLQSCDLDRDWHVLIGVIFFNLFYYKQQRRSGKMTDSLLYSLEGRCHTTLITQILRCFCRIHQSRIGRDDPLITYLYFLGSHYNLIPPPPPDSNSRP